MTSTLFARDRKTVVAMAHIGALPGSPLYDMDGGIDRLVEGVLRDVEKLQAGGVDAIMFGNENDRPYTFKATTESVAAMTAVVSAVKPSLTVPFGVNFLWDPYARWRLAAPPAPPLRARSLRDCSPPTWGFGSQMPATPCGCARTSVART